MLMLEAFDQCKTIYLYRKPLDEQDHGLKKFISSCSCQDGLGGLTAPPAAWQTEGFESTAGQVVGQKGILQEGVAVPDWPPGPRLDGDQTRQDLSVSVE